MQTSNETIGMFARAIPVCAGSAHRICFIRRSRSALPITVTSESAMHAAATRGLSSPKAANGNGQRVVGKGQKQILPNAAHGRAREVDGGGHQERRMAHQHHPADFFGRVGTGAGGNAKVRLRQGRSASLMPSPTMATFPPLACRSSIQRFLPAGLTCACHSSMPASRAMHSAGGRIVVASEQYRPGCPCGAIPAPLRGRRRA